MCKSMRSKLLEYQQNIERVEFTDYVRALDSSDGEPNLEIFNSMWAKLVGVMKKQLERRSLFRLPPAYLGIHGPGSWLQGNALEDLAAECYQFVFLDRLEGLTAHLKVKENVEGLVYRNIGYFFYEKQKICDPLGFSLYILIQRSVVQLVDAESLYALNKVDCIGSRAVLSFDAEVDAKVACSAQISELVLHWDEDFLSSLALAIKKNHTALALRLAKRILGLKQHGIKAFRFSDVHRELSREARARSNALLVCEQGDVGYDADTISYCRVQIVNTSSEIEDQNTTEKFIMNMTEMLASIPAKSKRQAARKIYLQRIWFFFKKIYLDGGDEAQRCSKRFLARQLGVPRGRISGLVLELQRYADQCRIKLRI